MLLDAGVAGIWCDMDEPALFVPMQSTMPEDVVHPGEAEPRLHAQVHNLYGSQMARAAREGLERLRPERRPFVITRAGFAGLQRHALHWTGDNSLVVGAPVDERCPQLQNLGLSGVAFCGVDVGGFYGDATGELLARWTELGIVPAVLPQPLAHGTRAAGAVGLRRAVRRALIRELLQLRMRLLPVPLQRCSRSATAPARRSCGRCCSTIPATRRPTRPTTSSCSATRCSWRRSRAPGIEHRHVYLPRGHVGALVERRARSTGRRTSSPTRRSASPRSTCARTRRSRCGPCCRARPARAAARADGCGSPARRARARRQRELYEDAGEGFGDSARRSVRCDGTRIELGERVGDYVPPGREAIELELRGVEPGTGVRVDGEPAEAREEDGALIVALEESPAARLIELSGPATDRAGLRGPHRPSALSIAA